MSTPLINFVEGIRTHFDDESTQPTIVSDPLPFDQLSSHSGSKVKAPQHRPNLTQANQHL